MTKLASGPLPLPAFYSCRRGQAEHYDAKRAPAGSSISIGGKDYRPGEFIPGDVANSSEGKAAIKEAEESPSEKKKPQVFSDAGTTGENFHDEHSDNNVKVGPVDLHLDALPDEPSAFMEVANSASATLSAIAGEATGTARDIFDTGKSFFQERFADVMDRHGPVMGSLILATGMAGYAVSPALSVAAIPFAGIMGGAAAACAAGAGAGPLSSAVETNFGGRPTYLRLAGGLGAAVTAAPFIAAWHMLRGIAKVGWEGAKLGGGMAARMFSAEEFAAGDSPLGMGDVDLGFDMTEVKKLAAEEWQRMIGEWFEHAGSVPGDGDEGEEIETDDADEDMGRGHPGDLSQQFAKASDASDWQEVSAGVWRSNSLKETRKQKSKPGSRGGKKDEAKAADKKKSEFIQGVASRASPKTATGEHVPPTDFRYPGIAKKKPAAGESAQGKGKEPKAALPPAASLRDAVSDATKDAPSVIQRDLASVHSDNLNGLNNIDVTFLDRLKLPGVWNEYLRQAVDGAQSNDLERLEYAQGSITKNLIPALRKFASEGGKVPLMDGTIDPNEVADFYETHGLRIVDALKKQVEESGKGKRPKKEMEDRIAKRWSAETRASAATAVQTGIVKAGPVTLDMNKLPAEPMGLLGRAMDVGHQILHGAEMALIGEHPKLQQAGDSFWQNGLEGIFRAHGVVKGSLIVAAGMAGAVAGFVSPGIAAGELMGGSPGAMLGGGMAAWYSGIAEKSGEAGGYIAAAPFIAASALINRSYHGVKDLLTGGAKQHAADDGSREPVDMNEIKRLAAEEWSKLLGDWYEVAGKAIEGEGGDAGEKKEPEQYQAEPGKPKLASGPLPLPEKHSKADDKVEKVMGEGKRHELHSGSKTGPLVEHGSAQEKAIAMSESGQSKK